MVRMEEEADALGADGIVAVRLTLNVHAWGSNVIEFLAIGTAVKNEQRRRARGARRTASRSQRSLGPGLLDAAPRRLSPARLRDGQLRLLRRAAAGPAGLGQLPAEHGARRARRRRSTTRASSRWSACRSRPRRSSAEGIVGVIVDENNHTWGSNVLEFSAVGTAVVADPRRPPHPDAVARAHGERLMAARAGRIDLRASLARVAQGGIPLRAAGAPRRGGGPEPQALHERSLGERVPARARRRAASPSRR